MSIKHPLINRKFKLVHEEFTIGETIHQVSRLDEAAIAEIRGEFKSENVRIKIPGQTAFINNRLDESRTTVHINSDGVVDKISMG